MPIEETLINTLFRISKEIQSMQNEEYTKLVIQKLLSAIVLLFGYLVNELNSS